MTQYVQVTYRAPTPEDVSFIYSSWLKSYRKSGWAKDVPQQVYFNNHKKVISHLLGSSHVLIAANPENTEQIFGYAVYQPSSGRVAVLHYLYVKHTYRKLGIGRDLLETVRRITDHDQTLPAVFTHSTQALQALSMKWNIVYNPYVIGSELFHEDHHHVEAG